MKNFTENTRVQVPAALHLCKLGYTYLDDLTSYNPQTNILTDIFIRSVKRLNPALTDLECSQLLDKIVGDKAALLKLAYQASAAILANLSGVQALCDNDGVFHEIIKSGRNRIAETD